jgi:Tfp pilus assembly protein PilX
MKTLKNQKGIALVVTIAILLMVSLIGLAAVLTSDTETNISVNQKNDAVAFYSAEGGLEAAQADLKKALNRCGF